MRSRTVRLIVGLLGLFALLASGCTRSSKTNEIGLVVSGGVVEDKAFEKCLKPGSTRNSVGVGSRAYLYPTDLRSWIGGDERDKEGNSTGNLAPGADTREIVVVSRDGIRLAVPFQLYFKLNWACAADSTLVAFHNNVGVKTEAYIGGDGSEANPADGWTEMIQQYFQPQTERSLERAAQGFDYKPLYLTEEARKQFEDAAVGLLKPAVKTVIGGDYFCGPSYNGEPDTCGEFTMTVGKPTPVDRSVFAGLEGAEAAKARIDQQVQENLQREKALEIRGKEIAQVGADNYTLLEAIKAGDVEIMVVPPGNAVTLPAR